MIKLPQVSLCTQLSKSASFSFWDLPVNGKKAIIQYRMSEDENLHQLMLNMLAGAGMMARDEADSKMSFLDSSFETLATKPDLWPSVIEVVDALFKRLDHIAEYKWHFMNIELAELISDVSSYEDYSNFDEHHEDYVTALPADRVHAEDDMWPVIIVEDDYEPIWDGWHRFHCAVRDKRSRISIISL